MASDRQQETQAPDATPPGGFIDAGDPPIVDQGPDAIWVDEALPGSPGILPPENDWIEKEELIEDLGSNLGATPEAPKVQHPTGRGTSARQQAAAQMEDLTGTRRQQVNPIDQSTKGEGARLSPASEPDHTPSSGDNPAL